MTRARQARQVAELVARLRSRHSGLVSVHDREAERLVAELERARIIDAATADRIRTALQPTRR